MHNLTLSAIYQAGTTYRALQGRRRSGLQGAALTRSGKALDATFYTICWGLRLIKQGPRIWLRQSAGAAAPLGLEPAAPNLLERVRTGDRSDASGERRPARCSVRALWKSVEAKAAATGRP